MPAEHALARNPNIRDEELKAAIDYLCAKIRRAAHKGQPVPFNAYRSKLIFEKALNIRTGEPEWASASSEKRDFVEQPMLQCEIFYGHFDGNSAD
ncbi:hypothetical protein ATU3B_13580 [Agrobacterium genomosp. 3 str. CIP 111-78]|nr:MULTISPECIES: hypothetical protein [Rhizobium/Agrobacterium group]KRA62288.1 hypothetical protein ASD85_26760 [Rhizobium sp. Root651]MCA2372654.1 hypothetical protein [Agrobacterium tomkonis CIP 111-78]MDH1270889.1 hypothetical protein [Agrobacterium pusense]